MSELNISPIELFNQNSSKLINVCINGIDINALELSDNRGNYLAIIAHDLRNSDNIVGTFIHGNWITEIDYDKFQGEIAIIKLYY